MAYRDMARIRLCGYRKGLSSDSHYAVVVSCSEFRDIGRPNGTACLRRYESVDMIQHSDMLIAAGKLKILSSYSVPVIFTAVCIQ